MRISGESSPFRNNIGGQKAEAEEPDVNNLLYLLAITSLIQIFIL